MSEQKYLSALARFTGDIKAGRLAFDYRTGQCSPAPATVLNSWGPGCPSGQCMPNDLPDALNRYFAGDRAGCREIPYCIHFSDTPQDSDTGGVPIPVNRTGNSKITMCPTRLIAFTDSASGQWELSTVQFGNQNQVVGGPVALEAFGQLAFQMVPMVPDCLRAGMPWEVDLILKPESTPVVRNAWLVFIGPMVG